MSKIDILKSGDELARLAARVRSMIISYYDQQTHKRPYAAELSDIRDLSNIVRQLLDAIEAELPPW